MMRFGSIKEWKNYCYKTHKSYIKNKYFRCWLKEKKVDIFNYTQLKERDVNQIIKTIVNALKLCSPAFKIKQFNGKSSELDFAVHSNNLDGAKILEMARKSRKGRCSASIFLANKMVNSGKDVLKFGDALTYVSDGVAIFTFDPYVKYPSRFFKAAVAHEIYHLMGLNIHHYDSGVEGYRKSGKCVMEYNAPSEKLCSKCKDGLLSFWEGINHAVRQ